MYTPYTPLLYGKIGVYRGIPILFLIQNICFEAKLRKIGKPCIPQFYFIKVGLKGGGYTLHRHVFMMTF